MDFKQGLEEIVLFELPSDRSAYHLLLHLTSQRLAWFQNDDEATVVGAVLTPDLTDFAELLRDVQSWLYEARLHAIRFEVDGRTYVLEAKQPALAPG